jgi:hypothetical protein
LHALALAFAVTLAHAIGLGVPAALFYRYRRWTGLIATLAGGFLVGAAPVGLLICALFVGGATTFDELPPSSDIAGSLLIVGTAGVLGALGAAVFWLVLKASGALADGQQQA